MTFQHYYCTSQEQNFQLTSPNEPVTGLPRDTRHDDLPSVTNKLAECLVQELPHTYINNRRQTPFIWKVTAYFTEHHSAPSSLRSFTPCTSCDSIIGLKDEFNGQSGGVTVSTLILDFKAKFLRFHCDTDITSVLGESTNLAAPGIDNLTVILYKSGNAEIKVYLFH